MPQNIITKEVIETVSEETGFKIIDIYEQLRIEFENSFKHIREFDLLLSREKEKNEKLSGYNFEIISYSSYNYYASVYWTMFGFVDRLCHYLLINPCQQPESSEDLEYRNNLQLLRNEIIEDMNNVFQYNISEEEKDKYLKTIPYYSEFKRTDEEYCNYGSVVYISYYWKGYELGKRANYEDIVNIYRTAKKKCLDESIKEENSKVYKKV